MKNKNHTFACYQYCNRVYGLNQNLSQIKDGRTNPTIKLTEILLTIIFSLMAGLHSFNSMEEAIKDGDFDKFFNNLHLPSADTFTYALLTICLNGLRKLAVFIVQKARYNKSLNNNTIDGLKVVAVDGTHTFTMRSKKLGKNAHKVEHKNDDGEITSVEYREKAIAASYVGEGFSPILKINRIPKGEGELSAAKKLINELNRDHNQYCDLIVGDSLYINAPFINTVLRNNKDVIKVVEAVKEGAIKKFFVMAGCDGRMKSRDYYTEFAEGLPEDTVILTAGCAKYRYNKLDLGDIGGIPRVLDAGQCNDSYSLAVIAMKLQEVFGLKDINELPIAYNIAWYEQKAVIVLLALLYLGVKNIHLGPTLPAFLSENVANVLVDKFGIVGITEVEDDIELFMAG